MENETVVKIQDKPWYKRYGLAILAGLGLVLTGLAMAFTGGGRGRSVGKLEKELRDIDDEQTRAELEYQKEKKEELETALMDAQQQNTEIHEKLAEAPDYDHNKSDAENLDTLRSVKW